ncbi:porin family protein [Rhodohalobacter sp.]|uniref:porin family protein n=1 Tax=Rhodohalobacter sp. TaxID=1974210 RepID=UPI002ACDAF86|nr:porin family protein [Rhodohalobacter sp.]MDZ7758430.1 porin family protein [Rhodohalobacter sp.]
MKKLTSLLIILFMTAAMIQQANAQSPVSFGLQAGMNISNFSGSDFEYEAKTGLTVGATLDISLPAIPFGIVSGVNYTQKGAKLEDEGVSGKIKVDYIEVPIMAKFQLGPPGPITPHFLFGPYIGFNMNAEAEFDDGEFFAGGDISDFTKSTEFGGVAAVGLDFSLGITKLNAQARYSYGFSSVFEDDSDDGEKNAVLSVVVGIMF